MYRTNFYGQSDAFHHYIANRWTSTDNLGGFNNNSLPIRYLGDSFIKTSSTTFEERLSKEMDAITNAKIELKKELSLLGDNIDQNKKTQIQGKYHIIERWHKLLELIVDQTQKSMQNIVSNFR